MSALDKLGAVDRHVVTQVVKAHFVVGAVCDVGGIGSSALLTGKVVDDETHGKTEEAMDLAHPLAVALGEVVVDGDNVHAVSGKTVEVGGQRCDQRFAFAGLHLGDATLMQHDAADELNAVRTEPEHAVRRFTHGGKRLGQNVIQRLTLRQPRLEFLCFSAQGVVGERSVFVLQRHDGVYLPGELFDLALGARAEHLRKKTHIRSILLRICA